MLEALLGLLREHCAQLPDCRQASPISSAQVGDLMKVVASVSVATATKCLY